MLSWLSDAHPELGAPAVMAASMAAGISTSVALETAVLRATAMPSTAKALETAIGMSFISMAGMEVATNVVEIALTGGNVSMGNPAFWTALPVSLSAGFAAPLPYNYYRLKKHGKSCH